MKTRRLGPFSVSAIGYGAMPLSFGGSIFPDEDDAIKTVHAALDAGITYIDTADIYAPSWDTMGHNEQLVAKALKSYGPHDDVVVGTKGGITRAEGEAWGRNASAQYLRSALDTSLRNLGVDVIELYQWHRPDHYRAYADGVQVLADLQQEGKIKSVGISNADTDQIGVAIEVLGAGNLASVQNRFSPAYRSSQVELELCGEHGIAFLAYGPLGGSGGAATIGDRFSVISDIAREHGVSPQQVVLAWELGLGDHVIPIPGASRVPTIVDSARAVTVELTGAEHRQLTDLNLGIR